MASSPMIFCHAPWSNLEILSNGDILPCCKFTPTEKKFNIRTNTIAEYRQSPFLEEIKAQFTQGQWPQGCERCRNEEAYGIASKRQLDYERWQQHYDSYDFDSDQILTISMAMGNTCNLKCATCNPMASSKWQKEYHDIYGLKFENIEGFRKGVIKDINKIAPNLIHLDIHGGEPFLSGINEHRELLDFYISNGQSKNISIHYTTNGTIWPDAEWFDRWRHFKEIDLQISIDGVGPRYEYLRFPADWSVLEAHVRKYLEQQSLLPNFRISVAHTVSAFNIFYLDEFLSWASEIGLPKPWLGRLHNPKLLRMTVWPERAKMYIVDHLTKSTFSEVSNWIDALGSSDDSILFDDFVKRVRVHDQYRNTDFSKVFPELATYI